MKKALFAAAVMVVAGGAGAEYTLDLSHTKAHMTADSKVILLTTAGVKADGRLIGTYDIWLKFNSATLKFDISGADIPAFFPNAETAEIPGNYICADYSEQGEKAQTGPILERWWRFGGANNYPAEFQNDLDAFQILSSPWQSGGGYKTITYTSKFETSDMGKAQYIFRYFSNGTMQYQKHWPNGRGFRFCTRGTGGQKPSPW